MRSDPQVPAPETGGVSGSGAESRLRAAAAPLTPDSPLRAWGCETIRARAETMLGHMDGVRLGEDIEAVHDMRVWSRRLVAALRVFADCFPGRRFRGLTREARQVTRALGAVRDLEVLIDHYERLLPEAEAEEVLGAEYLIAVKRREWRRARVPMLEALDELVCSQFERRLVRYLREAAVEGAETGTDGPGGDGSFRAAAPVVLAERYREFYAFEPHVHDPQAVTPLHEMRIAAKWLRYTTELFAPAYSGGLKREIATVKRFQELLGDLHDSDIRLEILDGMLGAPLDARGLEALRLMLPDPVTASLRSLRRREVSVRQGHYRAFYKEWVKTERRGVLEAYLQRIQQPDASGRESEHGGAA